MITSPFHQQAMSWPIHLDRNPLDRKVPPPPKIRLGHRCHLEKKNRVWVGDRMECEVLVWAPYDRVES